MFRGVLFVIFWKSRLFPSLKSSLQGAVILQSQLFRAGAGVQVSSFQGGEDGGFWQLQTVGDGVGGGLAALREGCADQREESFLISARHFNRRCFADVQADDRASDLGGRVKTAGLYGKKQACL